MGVKSGDLQEDALYDTSLQSKIKCLSILVIVLPETASLHKK